MGGPTREISILHVEDSPSFAELTATSLEREGSGFNVETAPNATDGLDRLSEGDFDCIVSDYEMPGMDGLEFLETVREEYPDLPFVLFTGKGSEEVAADAIKNGATDYLRKKTGTEQYALLANRIENAVEQYRASRRAADLDRIRSLVNDVNQVLVRASDREDVTTTVCEIISDADPYRCAWYGAYDPDSATVTPRTAACDGEASGDGAEFVRKTRLENDHLAARAARTRELRVIQDVSETSANGPWHDAVLDRGYRSCAAIPLAHDDALYGVLTVYADRPDAFDERERELLRELGDDIAHALYAQDLQARRRAERNRLTALFENTPDPVVAVSSEGDAPVIDGVNGAFEEVFGFEEASVTGREFADVLVPESKREQFRSIRDDVMQGSPVEAEVRRRTTDGTREFWLRAIPVDSTDGSKGAYVWFTDITERKEHERALAALHEAATDIEAADTETEVYETLTEVADAILDFALVAVDVVEDGALVQKAWTLDDAGEYYEETPLDEDTLATRVYHRGETLVANDLSEYDITPADPEYLSALTVPIGDHGTFQTVSRESDAFDETDQELAELLVGHAREALQRLEHERSLREQRERLRRENERLDQFASVVSHDLRNPLTVANGELELAAMDCDSDHLDEVATSLERMETIIEDVLAMARGGQAVEQSELESVDLASIADGCWGTVETDDADLDVDTTATVAADADRLRRVFENLFRNAVDHGGPAVTITVGDLENGFYVADDGPGIPEDERDRVFESGYSTTETGTGFGLAIVQELAEAHDWDVTVTDSDDGGARFEITDVTFDR